MKNYYWLKIFWWLSTFQPRVLCFSSFSALFLNFYPSPFPQSLLSFCWWICFQCLSFSALPLFFPPVFAPLTAWADGPSRGGAEEHARRRGSAAGERRRPIGSRQCEGGMVFRRCFSFFLSFPPSFRLHVWRLSSRRLLFVSCFLSFVFLSI